MRSRFVRALQGLASGFAAVGCFAAATGCYSYTVVAPGSVPPGTSVRAELSSEGVIRLEPVLGGLQRQVRGEVIDADGRQLLLLARTSGGVMDPGSAHFSRQRLVIEQGEILRLEQRQLEKARSAVFSGFVASALVGAALYFITGKSRGRDTTQPTDGPETH